MKSEVFYIALPRRPVEGLRGINDHLRNRIDMSPQRRLFQRCGEALFEGLSHLTPDEITLSCRHLQELAVSALSARDLGPLPGATAARLRLIKEDIATLLHQHDLSSGMVAARHGTSNRYLWMMFAETGTTFRDRVLEQRFVRVHAALCGPDVAGATIFDIAGTNGFADLSWFNQC